MVHYYQQLDRTFAALADPTRRAILARLGSGEASISELATPLGITLTGVKKHIQLLEDVELVRSEKRGRTRVCQLGPSRLDVATAWIEAHGRMLDARLDRFAALVERHTQATNEGDRS